MHPGMLSASELARWRDGGLTTHFVARLFQEVNTYPNKDGMQNEVSPPSHPTVDAPPYPATVHDFATPLRWTTSSTSTSCWPTCTRPPTRRCSTAACPQCRLGVATAHCPGLMELPLQGPGCATRDEQLRRSGPNRRPRCRPEGWPKLETMSRLSTPRYHFRMLDLHKTGRLTVFEVRRLHHQPPQTPAHTPPLYRPSGQLLFPTRHRAFARDEVLRGRAGMYTVCV